MRQILRDIDALKAIGWAVAILTIPLGMYMIGPWYVALYPASASFLELSTLLPVATKIVAGLLIVTAGMIGWGLYFQNCAVLKYGYIMATSLWCLIFVMRLISIGLLPMVWLQQLFMAVVAAVLALNVRTD